MDARVKPEHDEGGGLFAAFRFTNPIFIAVMAGLVPAIHDLR